MISRGVHFYEINNFETSFHDHSENMYESSILYLSMYIYPYLYNTLDC